MRRPPEKRSKLLIGEDMYCPGAVAVPVANIDYIATNVRQLNPTDPGNTRAGVMVKLKSGETVWVKGDFKEASMFAQFLGGLDWP